MSSRDIDLNDYPPLYAKIDCKYILEENITKDPMVVRVLTQYHVLKDIKMFGDPGIKALIK